MGGGTDGISYKTDRDGNPNVFNLNGNDDALWLDGNNWAKPDNRWNADNRFVFVARNFLHFSPAFAGEFCFASCPFQPPSILPISSTFTDKAIYFLLSRDFVSHRTISSILSVSVFRIANRTHGCFSSRERKLATATASMISTKKVSIFCPRECLWIFGSV